MLWGKGTLLAAAAAISLTLVSQSKAAEVTFIDGTYSLSSGNTLTISTASGGTTFDLIDGDRGYSFTIQSDKADISGDSATFYKVDVSGTGKFKPAAVGSQTIFLSVDNKDEDALKIGRAISISERDGQTAFYTVSAVPLPAALPLFGAAMAGLGGFGFLKRRKSV